MLGFRWKYKTSAKTQCVVKGIHKTGCSPRHLPSVFVKPRHLDWMKTMLKRPLRTDLSVFHGLLFHKTMNRDGSESVQWIAENGAFGWL